MIRKERGTDGGLIPASSTGYSIDLLLGSDLLWLQPVTARCSGGHGRMEMPRRDQRDQARP